VETEEILGVLAGIGLSAACGFRVFVPLLVLNIASLCGYVQLSPDMAWIGTWPMSIALSTATVLEIGAYYIPWLDHAMDVIATPAAVIAGTIVTASLATDMPPAMQWSVALIAGGGSAGVVQAGTVVLRTMLTATTGGMGNFIFSTFELVISFIMAVLALVVPVICAAFVALILIFCIRALLKRPRPPVANLQASKDRSA
jgi:uncharacterized protein DUF4126